MKYCPSCGTVADVSAKFCSQCAIELAPLQKSLANRVYAARIRADGEVVKASHARAVDDQTFDLAQQKLKENSRNP
jgi:hypothetical protein